MFALDLALEALAEVEDSIEAAPRQLSEELRPDPDGEYLMVLREYLHDMADGLDDLVVGDGVLVETPLDPIDYVVENPDPQPTTFPFMS
jgi:hypothetical protein